MEWAVLVSAQDGTDRFYRLAHEYTVEVLAQSEAEEIASQHFTDDDEDWVLLPVKELPKGTKEEEREL